MDEIQVWRGTSDEAVKLMSAVRGNCTCESTGNCGICKILKNKSTLDKWLFMRRIDGPSARTDGAIKYPYLVVRPPDDDTVEETVHEEGFESE